MVNTSLARALFNLALTATRPFGGTASPTQSTSPVTCCLLRRLAGLRLVEAPIVMGCIHKVPVIYLHCPLDYRCQAHHTSCHLDPKVKQTRHSVQWVYWYLYLPLCTCSYLPRTDATCTRSRAQTWMRKKINRLLRISFSTLYYVFFPASTYLVTRHVCGAAAPSPIRPVHYLPTYGRGVVTSIPVERTDWRVAD